MNAPRLFVLAVVLLLGALFAPGAAAAATSDEAPAYTLSYRAPAPHLEARSVVPPLRPRVRLDGAAAAFARRHGPDKPFDDVEFTDATPGLLVAGIAAVVASLVFTGLALSRNGLMEEATTRTELSGFFQQQKVFGTLGYSLFGAGAALIVIYFVVPK